MGPAKSDGQTETQLAAACLHSDGFHGSLPEQVEFELRHGSLQSEQEAIIHQAGIVDAVGVDDHSAYEPAELDQVMPIASVAGESGGFDAKYRANVAGTDIGYQLLEARTINLTPSGTAEIAIDRAHIMKT